MCLYSGTMGLRHSFACPYQGQAFLCVKKWFEAQISGILPDVFSYISHFVCLYNFNYTGRLLHGPGIIGINGSYYTCSTDLKLLCSSKLVCYS